MRRTRFFPNVGKFSRNLFVVSLNYTVPLDEVNKYLESHRAFLKRCYQQGVFVASGPKEPKTGGVIIASVNGKAALEAILSEDPFKKNGIAEYQITEFHSTMYDDRFSKIAESDRQFKR